MDKNEIHRTVMKQRSYFCSGATLPPVCRVEYLRKLKAVIQQRENEITHALKSDLGKSSFESYMCEIGMVLEELDYMIHYAYGLSQAKKVLTPIHEFPARSYIQPEPYGVVLIISPWNYPFLLSLCPMIDALAAGNTVVIKPSAYSPATSEIISSIVSQCYVPEYATVITGGRSENQALLDEKFNYIFFTGSQDVGRTVMEKASRFLTPVTLELGGKSPCIVDETADISLAARRIVFGKFLNCGQTCVAPDYVWVHESVKQELVDNIIQEIKKQYGSCPLENPDYGKIINEKHFYRICHLFSSDQVVYGGKNRPETFQIEPTVLDEVSWDDPVMQQEIFGPILPILTYSDLGHVIASLQQKDAPLALYVFSRCQTSIDLVTRHVCYGGGCINDTIIHLATTAMGFGGVGASGMGSYHGKQGFDTFSHIKSIVDKKCWMDLPMRYQPYKKCYEKLLHFFLR